MKVYNGNNSRRFLFEDAETKPTPTPPPPPPPATDKPEEAPADKKGNSAPPTGDTSSAPTAEGADASKTLNVGGVEIPNDNPNEALVIKYIIETALKAGEKEFNSEVTSIASKLNKNPKELEQDYKNAIIWKLIQNEKIATLLGKEENFKKYIQASKGEEEKAKPSESEEEVSENEEWIKNDDEWINKKLNLLRRKGII